MSDEAVPETLGTLGEFVTWSARRGDKTLAHFDDQVLSYGEADRLSTVLAGALSKAGVRFGDRVAALLHNCPEQVLIWFACAKLGAIWVPLNVAWVNADLRFALEDCEPRVAFVSARLHDGFAAVRTPGVELEALCDSAGQPAGGGLTLFDRLLADGDEDPPWAGADGPPVGPGTASAIVYTGGSTGMPKGVLLSHGYFLEVGRRYRAVSGATPQDVHYTAGHLFHSGGQQLGLMGPMTCGMTTAFSSWFSASQYWERARRVGATVIDPQGTMIAAIMRQPPSADDAGSSVRLGVGVGSAQIPRSIRDGFEERFGVTMLDGYAQTETGIVLCSELVDDLRGSAGRAHGWAEIRIADEQDRPVPAGQVGQILVRPSTPHGFMLGYYGRPAETLAACRNLWYHSGDLGYLDDDGYLYFVGREAHWIRHRGENLSAFEVESVVGSFPGIAACAAVGVPGELGDEDVKVYLELDDQHPVPFDPAELLRWCTERMAHYKLPRFVEVTGALPRTTTKQEIQRHLLRSWPHPGEAWDAQQELGLGLASQSRHVPDPPRES
jgi:carnitine-CoA ligase